MQLKNIKLAGFKSFVDPTTINLLSNLVAVVGPNGCGKSNVIDAVRWVMGESSAKHLRGGASTDVIFSGSSVRKPVGQATVELLFDNCEGKLGGEYATYAEIAIKRQVNRDGQSNYFLNGQRCRRRDITDIFIGTGLGPRSYAIIEQGMISRVIEAKPDDLRIFLEEAAGIARYKERRRETENRIQHTQDNLARLNDLRGELDNQLRHLQRQSQSAERYQVLKAQEQKMSAELAAMAWQRFDLEIKKHEKEMREGTTALEEQFALLSNVKTEQEKQRLTHTDANEALNEVQKRYYAVGSEIAKIEQTLQHHQERQSQLINDQKEAQETFVQTQAQLEHDTAQLIHLQQLCEELSPQNDRASEEEEAALEIQQQAEIALEQWRENVAKLQQAATGPSRQAEIEKSKIDQFERQIHQAKERHQRLENERQQQPNEILDVEIYEEKHTHLQLRAEELIEKIENFSFQKTQLSQQAQALRPQIKSCQKTVNEMQGQQAALQALQMAALGKDQVARNSWLAQHNLSDAQYLVEKLSVVNGWELAVETVLEGFIEAISTQDEHFSALTELNAFPQEGISFIKWQQREVANVNHQQYLIDCVKGECLPERIYHLLASVTLCQSMEEARAILPTLSPLASVITPQGYWLGHGWLKIKSAQQTAGDSILGREEKIKKLTQDLLIEQENLATLQMELETCEETLKNCDQEKEVIQQEKNRVQQELMSLQSERRIKQNRIEQQQNRVNQIERDLAECAAIMESAQQEVNVSRGQLHQALEEMAHFNQQQEIFSAAKAHLQEEVNNARLKVKEVSAKTHQLALTLQTYKTQITSLDANTQRVKQHIDTAKMRVANIAQLIEKNDEPVLELKETLDINLEKRIEIENELNTARDNVAAVDNLSRELEQKLAQVEQTIAQLREQLENIKMQWQAVSVRREGLLEKFADLDKSIDTILATMPPEANEQSWQEQIRDIEHKIQKLGAINLAAIEEYQAAVVRKEYLDAQCNDLTEALTTLETAIKKIDRETRTKFKETFDKVNDEFTRLFPRLFGGGHASLVLTGEDLLDTGISVIARPPGKKNSSISQLSGGEKALTAVALVFSIFQLNPAPFCMLDEVDAPLDDNNVARFCNLVKEMSKNIQFIYVSHNKSAIEMAEQLQGVTMREPGVSRLVTVDIEEAKSMALA